MRPLAMEVLDDPGAVARRAAGWIASEAAQAIAERGRFVVAMSGGTTPWETLRLLAANPVDWSRVHIAQVDERVVPIESAERNLVHLRESLLRHVAIPATQVHAMPVDDLDLVAAAGRYERELALVAGSPPVLDLVQLGLGADGHTASLVPGDVATEVSGADVAVTGVYAGRRRMTLTFAAINRARRVLWLVTGSEKADVVARLADGDRSIPASCVKRDGALLLADRSAAARLAQPSRVL